MSALVCAAFTCCLSWEFTGHTCCTGHLGIRPCWDGDRAGCAQAVQADPYDGQEELGGRGKQAQHGILFVRQRTVQGVSDAGCQ